jgi:hypothetical protein
VCFFAGAISTRILSCTLLSCTFAGVWQRALSNLTDNPTENTMKRITLAALAGTALLFAGAANAQAPDFSKVVSGCEDARFSGGE